MDVPDRFGTREELIKFLTIVIFRLVFFIFEFLRYYFQNFSLLSWYWENKVLEDDAAFQSVQSNSCSELVNELCDGFPILAKFDTAGWINIWCPYILTGRRRNILPWISDRLLRIPSHRTLHQLWCSRHQQVENQITDNKLTINLTVFAILPVYYFTNFLKAKTSNQIHFNSLVIQVFRINFCILLYLPHFFWHFHFKKLKYAEYTLYCIYLLWKYSIPLYRI